MRISNDGYINNTKKRLIQLQNNEKVSKSKTNQGSGNEKVDLIKAGIRETNASMRSIQTNITRSQIALENLNVLEENAGKFSNQELTAQDLQKINSIVENTVNNAKFQGENLFEELNIDFNKVNNQADFEKLMTQVQENINKMDSAIDQSRTELAKVSLRNENKLAVLSTDNNAAAKENVKSILENIGQIVNAQSNIMNGQVQTLINR